MKVRRTTRMRERGMVKLMYFLSGFAIGTGIGVMMAPRSGAATRHLISERAGDASNYVASSGRDYYERGRELYEMGRHIAEEAAELFSEGRRLMDDADAAGASA